MALQRVPGVATIGGIWPWRRRIVAGGGSAGAGGGAVGQSVWDMGPGCLCGMAIALAKAGLLALTDRVVWLEARAMRGIRCLASPSPVVRHFGQLQQARA